MTSRHVSVDLMRRVRRRANELCEYCGLPQSSQEAIFHVDHIVPRVAGGMTVFTNLALACVTCSPRKAARRHVRDPRSGKHVPIFHPRKHRWSEHVILLKSMKIRGKSATGRATVAALGMNRIAIVEIRRQLLRLGQIQPSQVDSE